jgi:PadR family transcriptional regulator PadR
MGLLQGTLDMLILRTLQSGPLTAIRLPSNIQRTTDSVLQVEHGSLYPALHRLEDKGLLAATWEPGTSTGRSFSRYRQRGNP